MSEPEKVVGQFGFHYPVWICVEARNAVNLLGGRLKDGGKFFPIFTEELFAERFITALGEEATAAMVPLPTPKVLAARLRLALDAGYTHLVVDHEGNAEQIRFIRDIPGVLKTLEGEP